VKRRKWGSLRQYSNRRWQDAIECLPGLTTGLFVPVYFIAEGGHPLRLVPVSMGVGTLKELYMFGMCMASAIGKSKDRVRRDRKRRPVAPGSPQMRLQGMRLKPRCLTKAIVDALKRMDVAVLARLDHGLIEAAGMCGLNPIVMMLGALEGYFSGLRGPVL